MTAIGENYAQELVAKFERQNVATSPCTSSASCRPTRCARSSIWSTSTRRSTEPALVAEIAKRAPGAQVLVQVNTTGEANKGGCIPAEVESLVDSGHGAGLAVDGLMTVGPTVGGPEAARPGFRLVRTLCDKLGLRSCSMGMSDDFVVAVQEGSTRVRLGSVLFGMRPALSTRVR